MSDIFEIADHIESPETFAAFLSAFRDCSNHRWGAHSTIEDTPCEKCGGPVNVTFDDGDIRDDACLQCGNGEYTDSDGYNDLKYLQADKIYMEVFCVPDHAEIYINFHSIANDHVEEIEHLYEENEAVIVGVRIDPKGDTAEFFKTESGATFTMDRAKFYELIISSKANYNLYTKLSMSIRDYLILQESEGE